jgi:hypothetical protein
MSFCVYTILYTLEDKKPEENDYVKIFLLWISQIAKINTAKTIAILVDERTAEYMQQCTIFPTIYDNIQCNLIMMYSPVPKTHLDGMKMKYTPFDYEEDYLMYLDVDIFVLKPLIGLLNGCDLKSDIYVHEEGDIVCDYYSSALNERELQTILDSGIKMGLSAGKFIIRNKEKRDLLFSKIHEFISENPDTEYCTVEQPIFNRGLLVGDSDFKKSTIHTEFISINLQKYGGQTVLASGQTILVDFCGESGDGFLHLNKMINFIVLENIYTSITRITPIEADRVHSDNSHLLNIKNVAIDLYNSRGYFTEESSYNSHCRNVLEVNIFSYLKYFYGDMLNQFWNTYTVPRESDKALIFVERRKQPNLEFCIKNAAYFARGYAIHIFCSDANLEFIKEICGKQLDNIHIHVVFKGFGTPEEGKTEYNELLKMREFWERFTEEHLITFETDCYLIKPIPESIYEFDYVASKWAWLPDEPGGGGLSYRKRSLMLEITGKFEPSFDPWQDGFVNYAIKTLPHRKVPTLSEANKYFVESWHINTNTVGMHQWWVTLDEFKINHLAEYLTFSVQ